MKIPRITLEDNGLTAIMKMADGNPGAVTVMARFLKEGDAIDPDAMLGGA